MSALRPLMFEGTAARYNSEQALAFQIVDPTYRIPMVWEVVTAEFGKDNYQNTYRPHVVTQGKKVLKFFDSLQSCRGIDRLWVTPTLIVAQGNFEHFDEISQEIKKVISEVFGEFNHQFVGENQIDIQIGLLMSRAA